jgi:hypothetical protein
MDMVLHSNGHGVLAFLRGDNGDACVDDGDGCGDGNDGGGNSESSS